MIDALGHSLLPRPIESPHFPRTIGDLGELGGFGVIFSAQVPLCAAFQQSWLIESLAALATLVGVGEEQARLVGADGGVLIAAITHFSGSRSGRSDPYCP